MAADSPITTRAEEVLQLFRKGAEFTQELLQENERLRYRILELEQQSVGRPEIAEEITDQNRRLLERIVELEREREEIRAGLVRIEQQGADYVARHAEIEHENRTLARLYAASYELHSTLDFDEVVRLVGEILHELLAAESFIVYLADDEGGSLSAVLAEGDVDAPRTVMKGEGLVGITFLTGENFYSENLVPFDVTEPQVTLALTIKESVIGVIALHRFSPERSTLAPLDRKVCMLLSAQAATSLFAARLYMNSTRKLNTIKGFLDLLKNQE